MLSIEIIFIVVGLLLLISTVSSTFSGRFGVPALLLFLAVGMLAGSEGIGGIPFDDAAIAQNLGIGALVLILFSGGLDTDWATARPALGGALALSTIGVAVTAAIVGFFIAPVLGLSLVEGLLLGAIVSSTDAAAVLSVLRTVRMKLKGNIQPMLELESGSNDPMAVFLTTALIGLLLDPSTGVPGLLGRLVLQMAIGAAAGYGFGRFGVWLINVLKLEAEGLYPVLTLSLAVLVYGATAELYGNGFLAVYVAGIIMGNSEIMYRRSLKRFHEGLAWLMQIVMFLALGMLVFPSQLTAVMGVSLLVAAVLTFVARPLGVFIALAGSRMSMREKTLVSWVGLKGAVPIILATFPLIAGVSHANLIFNVVFFVVLVSVLLQGTTIPLVARWLRVGAPLEARQRAPIEFEKTANTHAELLEIIVPSGSPSIGIPLAGLGFPQGALVVLINRDEQYVVPRAETVLNEGDVLMILAEDAHLAAVRTIIAPPRAQLEKSTT